MGNNNKNTIKKLIESNAAVQKKVAELKTTVDELLDKPDFNALYAKWKAENQAIPDIPPVVVEPEPTPTPEPEPVPEPTPTPEPMPAPTDSVIFDSHRDTKLHDSQVRTVKTEGNVTAGGLGCECHASGDPRMVVNNDGTFSLVANGPGHGRFYVYALNYNSTLEIEAAFWNEAAGQDLSLKTRSRHNEGGDGTNRFGGYGLAIDRNAWDAKREIWHNEHDESASGALPVKPETKKYFTIRFTVKDDGAGKVIQTGEMDGKKFMTKTDSAPKPYMVDQASFAKQSYFWVRQNLDSGTGEIRIKQLRLLKA